MAASDWWVVLCQQRDELRSVLEEFGELCVMTRRVAMMPEWSAGSWDCHMKMHLPGAELPLGKGLVPSSWIMWDVWELRLLLPTVPTVVLVLKTVVTVKMLEWCAKVSTNGFLFFGSSFTGTTPVLFSSSSVQSYVVAPFWADIDTTFKGQVSYQTYTTGSSELSHVSTFVSNKMGVSFSGSWMIVAEWDEVPLDGQSTSLTNTFQAIIIFDGTNTYAVFFYRCGDLDWGANAAIGFKASSYYRNHPLSTTNSVQSIACVNSPASVWSNVVYKISSGDSCSFTEFGCNNGQCLSSSSRCTVFNGCGDGSDEEFCSSCSGGFLCNNGRCIASSAVGNGVNDCMDSSDESTNIVNCGSLTDPVNGRVTLTGTTEGSTATYSCNLGYDLIGVSRRTCQSNGQWSDEPPVCSRCDSDEFECDNGRCIPDDDECNGEDDCLDNSDEDHCDGGDDSSVGEVVGAVVGSILTTFLIFCCLCICCCYISGNLDS